MNKSKESLEIILIKGAKILMIIFIINILYFIQIIKLLIFQFSIYLY